MASPRSRSPSPVRAEPAPKKQKTSGFKWKEKKPKDPTTEERDSAKSSERGYRNRSPQRDSYRDRGRDDNNADRPAQHDHADERRRRDEGGADSYRPTSHSDQQRSGSKTQHPDQSPSTTDAAAPRKEKKKKAPKPAQPQSSEPMIIVNINDRLGTKAAIPCLASDSIKAFKAVVAAHIGRQPHEIMLKRQGERPFKDQLSLMDYGVSNGVQLDLELDTGD